MIVELDEYSFLVRGFEKDDDGDLYVLVEETGERWKYRHYVKDVLSAQKERKLLDLEYGFSADPCEFLEGKKCICVGV